MELLIGCGGNRDKKISTPNGAQWGKLTTLDVNPDHKPDVLHDLHDIPLPFADDTFDEVHAYEVLEHVGKQGDYKFFFAQWEDFWRILKPGGLFCGTCPHVTSPWAWGDPGHTRIVNKECFSYLRQPQYTLQVGITHMSDYRFVYKADFEPLHLQETDGFFIYVMQAIKPSRVAPPSRQHNVLLEIQRDDPQSNGKEED